MKSIQFETDKKNPGHYSPGMISGNVLYVSGQLPVSPVDRSIPETFRDQVIRSLDNVERILEKAGLTKESVVMCRAYVAGIKNWDEFNIVYREWFGDHKPARVVVPVSELHYGALVEIECVAEIESLI